MDGCAPPSAYGFGGRLERARAMPVSAEGSPTVDCRRVRARLEGAVQGVGFRPFVYRLATSLRLGGFVLNDGGGVRIEVEGRAGDVGAFLDRLTASAPARATVRRVTAEDVRPRGDGRF